MMKYFAILALTFLPRFGFGQTTALTDAQVNASGANKLVFADSVSQAVILAKEDIARNVPFLLLQGGEAPVLYPKDSQFQTDFRVFFYDFGCIAPDHKFIIEYNMVVFDHLTRLYGKKWVGKVRKDVIGLKEFKRGRK